VPLRLRTLSCIVHVVLCVLWFLSVIALAVVIK